MLGKIPLIAFCFGFRVPLQTVATGECTNSAEKNIAKTNGLPTEGSQKFRQVSINENVTAIDVETSSASEASRQPKLSTVSNNMEMADLLRHDEFNFYPATTHTVANKNTLHSVPK